jgi:hypothetical protein
VWRSAKFQCARAFEQLGFVVLALGVEDFVERLPNCRNDHNVVLRHGVI